MKVIFTGGGTAGHINPALAVAGCLRRRIPDAEILYVGRKGGMEDGLVQQAGFAFRGIEASGFLRSFSPSAILHNLKSVGIFLRSRGVARRILKEFRPDVVVGTGGYVSGAIMSAAASMGIATITHEQNAFPGVTTKYISKKVDLLLLAFEDAKKHFPDRECIVVGNPVRSEIVSANRAEARKELGVEDKFVIVSYGGSLGAAVFNDAVADVMQGIAGDENVRHIHATGKKYKESFAALLKEKGVDITSPTLDIREYISNAATCYAAADLMICRAGAVTLAEIPVVGVPSILIPSPNVTENHQYHNAMTLVTRDAAIVIEEKDLTGKKLLEQVCALRSDPERLRTLGENAARMAVPDAADRICDKLLELVASRRK